MEQVDQAYIDELLNAPEDDKNTEMSESKTQEPMITYEEIREMAKEMGRGNREHDMTVIVHFIQVSYIYSYFQGNYGQGYEINSQRIEKVIFYLNSVKTDIIFIIPKNMLNAFHHRIPWW